MIQLSTDNIPEYDRPAREVPETLDWLLSLHSIVREKDSGSVDRWFVADAETGKRLRDGHGEIRLSFAKPLGVYINYLRLSESMRNVSLDGRDLFEQARDEYESQLKRRTHANSSSRSG